MSELTDLNATGNGLSAVSGGLQGLLEAYKMKMAQNVEQTKVNQQGLDAGAAARAQAQMMAPYRQAQIDQAKAALAQKTDNDAAQRRIQAFSAGLPDPGGSQDGPSPMAFAVRNVINGNADPASLPKSGPQYLMLQRELQNQGAPDMGALQSSWNQKFARNNPAGIKDQQNAMSMLDTLETMKSIVPKLGLADSPGVGAQAAYAKNLLQSNIAGTPAKQYLSMSGPQTIENAHEVAGRFSIPELEFTGPQFSMNNTNSDLLGNITRTENTLLEKSGLAGKYTPKVVSSAGVTPVAPPAAPSPPASSGLMGTLRAALPGATPAPAVPVAPAAASGPQYSDPNKAAQIAAGYKAGPQTPEAYAATKKQLDALTVGGQ